MKKNSGFTMIELMTTLAVLAIVLAIGAPQLMIFFQGNRMVTNTNDLVAGLHVARSEAVKRGHRVSICKSSNADSVNPTCDTSGSGWETGFIVFEEDSSRSVPMAGTVGDFEPSNNDVLLRVNSGAEGTTTVTTDNAGIQNFVSFTSRGEPKLVNGAAQSGLFRVCDDRGLTNAGGMTIARGVVLSPSGRVRISKDPAMIVSCP